MLKLFYFFGLCFLFLGCTQSPKTQLKAGMWRAVIEVGDGQELPFNFELTKIDNTQWTLEIRNAEERILVEEINVQGDSIFIQMPVFEGRITGAFTSEKISGVFTKESLDRTMPFTASFGEAERFASIDQAKFNISGVWETTFSQGTDSAYVAKGIFYQKDNEVTGTFRTKTGDYRFLQGVVDGNEVKLSAFDGAHAFLFTATLDGEALFGTFYSDNHWIEPFVAKRNEAFELPDADSLTYLKDGFDAFEFTFPHQDGALVGLKDEYFENKVVLVQIMGTWCPNCLDETKFYVDYLRQQKNADLKMVALAFESAKTKEKAFAAIDRLVKRVGVPYPVLLAQYGTTSKTKANEKLPMLNAVLSYPTTIYIDKKGRVRKIHTGFNGPATGEKYEQFKLEFSKTINMLLAE
ncbi:Phenylalanyl-tRNA synthetase beta subunit [Croceitalea dokdonensis DOKDO 023]|uniref:Phenylalanyl-tRNA synthetase beta subunit n=1 Tax=Croceitalea dokdonensis DOKDO 023 TaxID=1300341 RepID=A0A0P7B4I1_9FLAO|nr:TlpA disulfide reductase family protein [Croceitalea dokdonensis]KPM33631.1 Phenylalanyl-tRNA synthetase beta subunit [Croceitalea dokdonensis DOKDO 023]